jgi:hypothetical protein
MKYFILKIKFINLSEGLNVYQTGQGIALMSKKSYV